MTTLVTGCAGFIGMWTCERLLQQGFTVVGIDNLNDYYAVKLKEARLARLSKFNSFSFKKVDIANKIEFQRLFEQAQAKTVIHLAAQAGVRHSLENPKVYIDSNIIGFQNLLELCKDFNVSKLIYASSSSVYGLGNTVPYKEEVPLSNPSSLYAATKIANEAMAYAFSHNYNIPTIGLRFFTVYGPWGRPDMAYFSFTEKIKAQKRLLLFNYGNNTRDFTYITDIVDGIESIFKKDLTDILKNEIAPSRIYNIGGGNTYRTSDFIKTLENILGMRADFELCPPQPGDVFETQADTSRLKKDFAVSPKIPLAQGLEQFVKWHNDFTARKSNE